MLHFATTTKLIPITVVLVLVAVATCVAEPNENLLLNPGAEDGKGDLPSLWSEAAIQAEGLQMCRDSQYAHSGKFALYISNTHKYDQTVCNNWAQHLESVPVGKVIQLSAYVKSENADSVNVCLQCWGLGDSEKMLAFTSTNVLRGDNDWVLVKTSSVMVPAGTVRITVRAVLTGLGKAWFDDLSVKIIDLPTKDTNDIPARTSTAQSNDKKYDQKQIQEQEPEFFFGKIGNPEPGYHGFSGLWALEEKGKISDAQTKENIIAIAGTIIKDSSQTPFRRWQCCYVIKGIGDSRGISSLIYALTKDEDTTVRGCAACALGAFNNEQAVNALKQAKETEKKQEVLDWINKALDGQFFKK